MRAVTFSAASASALASASPPAGGSRAATGAAGGGGAGAEAVSASEPVMQVVGCTNDFGLGLVSWW